MSEQRVESWRIDPGALSIEPWAVTERELRLDLLGQTESIFALSNGHIGLRGNLDEGEPHAVAGSYLNGLFEALPLPYAEGGYGYPEEGQSLLNVTNGKLLRLLVDDEPFDVRYGTLERHERVLDLRAGVLRRDVRWRSLAGQAVRVRSTRLVSFVQRAIAAVLYEVEPLEQPARVVVQSTLIANEPVPAPPDDPRAAAALRAPLVGEYHVHHDLEVSLGHRTRASGLRLAAALAHLIDGPAGTVTDSESEPDLGRVTVSSELEPGQTLTVVKFLAYGWSSRRSMLALRDQVDAALAAARRTGWDGLVAAQREYLDEVWGCADVELEGDPELQQAVRFGLFHVVQSAARAEARGIPAKGLTGRGYDGHTFWDMEAYVLPVLTYSSPGAARDALLWRHRTLGQATARARELRLAGAAFPWRTIRGEECSGYWPAGTAAFHINANIAEAVRRYVAATDDAAFEGGPGLELFVGTARLWRSLGHHDAEGRFRIDGVTGPDEYTALVNNNTFTNLMAARNLRAAADAASRHPTEASALDVDDDELASWHTAADAMVIPFDSELGVTSQSEGFTRFRRWDFGATGADEYPLLLHFPYYLLYSSQVVKQADLVFALYACGDHFTPEQKRRDFEYYEAITVRDSSLSACIQAIVAAEVGHLDLAYEYFRETALVDLRNLAGNTAAGVHLGSLAGAWLVAVAGFGGLRDQDGTLAFAPRLPPSLESVRFRVRYRGRRLAVAIGRDGIRYELLAGEPLEVLHEGQPILLVAGSPQEQPCSPPPAVTPVRPPPGCEPSYADVDARSSRDRPAAGRRFRGGIFDVDGVLVDSPHEKAWREALRELMEGEWSEIRDRTTWSPDAFTSLVYREAISGKPRMSGARAALQYFHVPDDEEESRVARYAERKHSIVERLIGAGDFTAYRDALGFIIAVKDAGLRLAAASSSKNAKLLLSRIRLDTFANENGISSRSVRPGLSLLDYFDVDVSGLDFTHGKPDPEMFLTAAQELGVTPEESVVVEDAAAGIEAAKAGRMAAIGIARADDADLLAEAGADLVVSSLDQVDVGALARGLLATRGPGPGHPRDDARAGGRAAETRARPGGAATVDEMSEWSFPASDPPATWTWEVP